MTWSERGGGNFEACGDSSWHVQASMEEWGEWQGIDASSQGRHPINDSNCHGVSKRKKGGVCHGVSLEDQDSRPVLRVHYRRSYTHVSLISHLVEPFTTTLATGRP